ncbi:MAG TPA: cupin domain-containing protein [Gemmatimonadota bacterium]|nr:cupin domain-containing protein [Gemmatimonadota bacterium]
MTQWTPIIAAIGALALPLAALAQEQTMEAASEPAEHAIVTSEAVAFQPLEVPGFDPGIQLAVIHGNPEAEAGDYTVRLALPAGYRFPAHYHPKAEHVTVLSGTFLLAMGEVVDPAAIQSYAPGAFIYIPAEHPHYGGAEGETVIQLHGEAPFKIVLVESGS